MRLYTDATTDYPYSKAKRDVTLSEKQRSVRYRTLNTMSFKMKNATRKWQRPCVTLNSPSQKPTRFDLDQLT
jgi:hypothetical protein